MDYRKFDKLVDEIINHTPGSVKFYEAKQALYEAVLDESCQATKTAAMILSLRATQEDHP